MNWTIWLYFMIYKIEIKVSMSTQQNQWDKSCESFLRRVRNYIHLDVDPYSQDTGASRCIELWDFLLLTHFPGPDEERWRSLPRVKCEINTPLLVPFRILQQLKVHPCNCFNDCNLMIMLVYFFFLFDNEIRDGGHGNLLHGLEIWDQYCFFVEVGYICVLSS